MERLFKKTLSTILAIVFIVSMVNVGVLADSVGELVVGSAAAGAGEEVVIPVSMTANPGVAVVALRVSYAKDVTLVKVNDKGVLGAYTHGKELTANPYKLYWNNNIIEEDIVYTGDIVELTFKINDDATIGDKNIEISYDYDKFDIINVAADPVKFNITNGSITVKGEEFGKMSLAGIPEESVTYNGEAHVISVAGLEDGATVSYTVNNVAVDAVDNTISLTNAGTYKIVAKVTKTGFTPVELEGTLVIDKAALTISGEVEKVYDGKAEADITNKDITVDGVIGDDEVNFQLAETTVAIVSADVAGSPYSTAVALDEWTGADVENYDLPKKAEVSVTVKPLTINVTLNNATKVAGVDGYPLSYDNDDLIGEDILNGNPSVNITKDVAGEKYRIEKGTIEVSPAEHAGNYDLKFSEAYLTIVEKRPTEVVVTGSLKRTEYWEGEIIDAAGLTVVAKYENGTEEEVSIADCVLNPSVAPDVDEDTIKTITVSYLDVAAEKTFDITVKNNYIIGIKVEADDAKDVYFVGDTLDKTGLVVTATYANGGTAELDADEYELSAELTAAKEDTVVTVTADGKTGTYTVTVADKELKALKVNGSPVSLVEGQTFVLADSGVTFEREWADGIAETVTNVTIAEDNIVVKKTDNNKEIAVSYTYTYGRYTATVENVIVLHVAAKVVTSVEVVTDPTKTEYIEGTAFDPAGVQIKVTYNDGEEITADADNYADYGISFTPETLELGDKTVTVACGGKTDTITVEVNPRTLTGIEVTVNKDEYIDGESFDKADIAVKAEYDNGDAETVTDYTVDADTFVLAVANKAETQTVTVTYGSQTDAYTVDVVPCAAVNETTGKRYASIDEAFEDAEEGDEISIEIAADDVDVDVEVEVTITNNTGDEITITVNDEEITIADDESHTVEIEEEDAIGDYYFFYMQMLQWRNRMFKISYKQTEGGEISGSASVRNGETAEITVTPDEGYAIADVLVNGKSVGAVESYKIRNIKSNQTVSAVFEKIAATSPFVDVSVDAPYFDAVLYVYNNGIINGVSETEMVFAPDTTMTRAMFVTVLGRMSGVNMADYPVVTFADCEAGSWYAPYVEWAAQAGIVKGYSAETFGPMDEITVEQAAVILYRYIAYMGYNTAADADLANYADGAQVSEWAAEQMKWALANNIYVSDTTLDPQAPAARSLVAEMLYNLSVWMG